MFRRAALDAHSEVPLYVQLSGYIRSLVEAGELRDGERLPPTRQLAGELGLNRTTVSAAYAVLEREGLLRGHVGRGSFINAPGREPGEALASSGAEWSPAEGEISFASSRPSELLFPLDEFRATCREVIEGDEAQAILQLGSPFGYAPLRRYLLARAREEGAARAGDDILITSGVQQGFDLIQRVLAPAGETVFIEDPVYAGLRNVFLRAGARVAGVPVGADGVEIETLERMLARERPRLIVLTSNFQNPTGATLPLEARRAVVRAAAAAGTIVVENDIYGELSYGRAPLPTLKQVDASGDTVLLRSFSKLAFPGLRVGWVLAPRTVVARLAEAKQYTDLHTDQLAQAVLLRFAESGRLEAHRRKVRSAGAERLRTALACCAEFLPDGARYSKPWGGMNLWVRLPEPLDAGELLGLARREGVTYTPGRHFAVSRAENGSLRISFAQLAPERIRAGMARLGKVFQRELAAVRQSRNPEAALALV